MILFDHALIESFRILFLCVMVWKHICKEQKLSHIVKWSYRLIF